MGRSITDLVLLLAALLGWVLAALVAQRRLGPPTHGDSRTRSRLPDAERLQSLVNRTFDAARSFDARLMYEARHDSLTGLLNRLGLDESLTAAAGGVTLLFVNLDRFKLVNDCLGHLSGDAVLREVARRLERVVAPVDIAARFGGDSFLVVRPGSHDARAAVAVGNELICAIGQPMLVAGRELVVSASVGIAAQSLGPVDPVRLLREAEAAMYQAKARGRGRCRLFEARIHNRLLERLEIERELRHALSRGDLRVHYQPIVSIPDGEVRGFEALVRWLHPRRGPLCPGAFVPVAEESGLIVPIGEWVLREACGQAAHWNRDRTVPLTVAVNLSARQLTDGDPVALVDRVLRDSGLPADQLTIEITESVVMADPAQSGPLLHRLRALGVSLSMDDFGTGYSSLAYLQNFPFSAIKIDASFIAKLEQEDGVAIVDAILRLADALGLGTVAEGVESMAQVEKLWQLGCRLAQGFYYSCALPAAKVLALLGAEERIGHRPGTHPPPAWSAHPSATGWGLSRLSR